MYKPCPRFLAQNLSKKVRRIHESLPCLVQLRWKICSYNARESGNHTRKMKKPFDLGGNRTHDPWIRSTVTLPTELRGRTEKVRDDLGGESWGRDSKGTYECCTTQDYEHKWWNRELTLKHKFKC